LKVRDLHESEIALSLLTGLGFTDYLVDCVCQDNYQMNTGCI